MTKKEKLAALMSRLLWVQDAIRLENTNRARIHIHNAIEILKEIDGN